MKNQQLTLSCLTYNTTPTTLIRADTFHVYRGKLQDLSALYFSNILRFPSCFYFFSICSGQSIPELNADELMVVRRDICWLTDPLPPQAAVKPDSSIFFSWPTVNFCGVSPTIVKGSIQYTLEIAEGIDFRPGYFSSFMSDAAAIDYNVMFTSSTMNCILINGLKPAKWYHARLIIDYLGVKVVSETQSVHTSKAKPGPPSIPRIGIIPIRNSFDIRSDVPARLDLLISWHEGSPNGSNVSKYQLQIQRFNSNGDVIQSAEELRSREAKILKKLKEVEYELPVKATKSNQWIASSGRSLQQLHNSIAIAERSPERCRSPDFLERKSRNFSSRQSYSDTLGGGDDGDRRFKWEILSEGAICSTKKHSPGSDEAEWHLRVRALNGEGWSAFSEVLLINAITHPSLFVIPPPAVAKGSSYYNSIEEAAKLSRSKNSNNDTASTFSESKPSRKIVDSSSVKSIDSVKSRDSAADLLGEIPVKKPSSSYIIDRMMSGEAEDKSASSGPGKREMSMNVGSALYKPPPISLHWGDRSSQSDRTEKQRK